MSEFDEWKEKVDTVLTKLNAECDKTLEKYEAWKESMRDQWHLLAMSIARLFEGEALKNQIESSMVEVSKVRKEMKETITTVMGLQDELARLNEEQDVIMQGSPDEWRLIQDGIDQLYLDNRLPTVSRKVEWLKGFGRAVESYMMFWAKEKDQMDELYERFEGNEAEWDAMPEVRKEDHSNPMYR